ncbi:MAG TPA: hypothetical protein VKR79_00275 [Gaiellaceae bacterium]|nr:hypothetical protein [Gaiellaceae bacterium]
MKAILTTSLVGLITVAVNLIGLIAVAAAASSLVSTGNDNSGHRAHHAPVGRVCAQTCPLRAPSS